MTNVFNQMIRDYVDSLDGKTVLKWCAGQPGYDVPAPTRLFEEFRLEDELFINIGQAVIGGIFYQMSTKTGLRAFHFSKIMEDEIFTLDEIMEALHRTTASIIGTTRAESKENFCICEIGIVTRDRLKQIIKNRKEKRMNCRHFYTEESFYLGCREQDDCCDLDDKFVIGDCTSCTRLIK